MDKHKLLAQFLETWSLDRLRNMTIEEYTNLNKSDSFCYWLEQKTNELGGITGGSSFKFGIYKRNNTEKVISTSNGLTDGEYAWFDKYGQTRDEAFETVRSIIVQIAQLATDKEFDKIDQIDLGESTKWKIAFMYSDYQLINTFSKDMVCSILDFLQIKYSYDESRFSLSNKILSQKKDEEDYFDFGSKFWNEILISQTLKKILVRQQDRLNSYFEIMDQLVEELSLEPNSDQYYFNYDKKENRLVFTIGQRYIWRIEKDLFKYISLNKSEDAIYEFSGSPEAYTKTSNILDNKNLIVNEILEAANQEIKRTSNSSFKKNNKKDLQELVFNKEFRNNVLSNIFKNKRKFFIEWLNKNFGDKNGTNNSYVRAIDILCEILKIDLFSISEIDYFDELYEDLILNQRDDAGKYYYEKAKSYGEKGFYSASIQTYKRFLSEIDNELVNINVTIPTMSKNAELLKYKKQIILQGSPGTGKTRLAKEIAKELIGVSDLNDSEQFKLLQFHPSYTYEDFVRGIVSKPNDEGDGIVYEAENKILAEFAKKALENHLNSKGFFNKYEEFDEKLKILLTEVDEAISKGEIYSFGNKSTAEIIYNKNKGLVYRFPNRKEIEYNLLFDDLRKVYENKEKINTPIDLRDKEKEFGLVMKGKYPYYYMLLKQLENIETREKQLELEKNYVLIIDEINRANLSSVLGELIYALEYRGEAVESMYEVEGNNKLILPPNLYIIGTMNTADRSVGHIDYAIRRRFAFVDVLPKDLSSEEGINFDSKLFHQVTEFFETNLSPEFKKKDVQLGHSYFIQKKEVDEHGNEILFPNDFNIRLEYEIKPILLEYVKDGVLIGEDINQKIEDLEVSI